MAEKQQDEQKMAATGRVSSRVVYKIHWWSRRRFRSLVLALGCPCTERGGLFAVDVTPEEERWLDVNGGIQ